MNLALIGYRGTGKTTVAQALAKHLAWPVVDLDVELERRAGKTISQIFADSGEGAFRELEALLVAEYCAGMQQILSLGGGAVLRAENRAAIRGGCRTAWLTASPETIYQRISTDPTTGARRPNLTAQGGLAEIVAVLAAREDFYRECADCIVATEGRSPDSIAEEILMQLGPALGVTK
jgi:shikimate kinase